jgi:hypothetical protein
MNMFSQAQALSYLGMLLDNTNRRRLCSAVLFFLLTSTTRIKEASAFIIISPAASLKKQSFSRHVFVPENFNSDSTIPSTNSDDNTTPSATSSTSRLRSKKDNKEAQRFFRGAPSTPGFKPGQFEKLTHWAISTSSNRPVVAEYDPDGLWLWTRWDGTIRQMTYKNVVISLLWAFIVDLYAYYHYTLYLIATAAVNGGDVNSLIDNLTWVSFEIPHSKDPIIETLTAVNGLWEYQLTLTIFTLSFFVNHAYTQWRMTYFCTRAIQGRINGLVMLVSTGAKRSAEFGKVDGTIGYDDNNNGGSINGDNNNIVNNDNSNDDDSDDKKYNNNIVGRRSARKLVEDVARYLRISHTFFWASTPTHSDGFGDRCHTEGGIVGDDELLLHQNFDASQFGPMLLSTEGLDMLVDYEQITQREKEALIATGLPPSQYSYVLLEWAGIRCIDGMEHGELRGTQAMEDNILRLLNELRAEYFNIGDYNAGRMPMAYVQVMEVFVDTLTFLAPLALYTKMGPFNILSTGLLTLFFKGLLELSKSFLDPFGREGYRAHNIRVDVLVSELNFGASSRWIQSGDALPSEILLDGNSNVDEDVAVNGGGADASVAATSISTEEVLPPPPPLTAAPATPSSITNESDANTMEDVQESLSKMATMNAIWEEYYGNDANDSSATSPGFHRGGDNNNNNVLADLTNYKKIGTEQKKSPKTE